MQLQANHKHTVERVAFKMLSIIYDQNFVKLSADVSKAQ